MRATVTRRFRPATAIPDNSPDYARIAVGSGSVFPWNNSGTLASVLCPAPIPVDRPELWWARHR